jgi:uncharacterized protein (TIGR03437 family)
MQKISAILILGICLVFGLSVDVAAQQRVQGRAGQQHKVYMSDIDVASLASVPSQSVPVPTTIQIDIYDTVAYVGDVPYDQLMSSFARTLSLPKLSTNVTAMGDIRNVSGRPAKGLYVNIAFPIFTTPNPSPENGFSISDATRIAAVGQCFDLMTDDGNQIGSIFAWGFAFGPPAPGAPLASGGGSIALIGGTGPYLGIRGQMYTTQDTTPVGDNPSVRFASAGESPAVRRVNQGGLTKFLLQIFPTFSPDALSLDDVGTPAAFHIYDESVISRANPAAAGETVTAFVRNLGPTNPAIDFGQPFSRTPLNVASSPVEVMVGGKSAEVTFAAGRPGAVNVYDLEFKIPPSTPSGRTMVQVFVGYVGGVPFPIYVE